MHAWHMIVQDRSRDCMTHEFLQDSEKDSPRAGAQTCPAMNPMPCMHKGLSRMQSYAPTSAFAEPEASVQAPSFEAGGSPRKKQRNESDVSLPPNVSEGQKAGTSAQHCATALMRFEGVREMSKWGLNEECGENP